SNDYITKITLDNGIAVYNFNTYSKLISKKQLLFGEYTFLDICFDINEDDNFYGILNDKKGAIIYVYGDHKIISKSNFIKYDSDIFEIKSVYIKNMKENVSILYYLLDKSKPYKAKLISHHKICGQWIKHEVDSINYQILTDFKTIIDEKELKVFYFKTIKAHTELFMCYLTLKTGIWSSPIQITNSGKHKVYLSVIMDSNNKYHITYSENKDARYNCMYLNGKMEEDKFIKCDNLIIAETVACTFPCIAQYNNNIYIQWNEYQNVYTSISESYGETWSGSSVVSASLNSNFLRCNYKSNYAHKINVNLNTIFAEENSLDIFKFINDPRA
ncbi:MAG: hypothetical protein ACRDA5_12595, partial [Clostridium sp.]